MYHLDVLPTGKYSHIVSKQDYLDSRLPWYVIDVDGEKKAAKNTSLIDTATDLPLGRDRICINSHARDPL